MDIIHSLPESNSWWRPCGCSAVVGSNLAAMPVVVQELRAGGVTSGDPARCHILDKKIPTIHPILLAGENTRTGKNMRDCYRVTGRNNQANF